jgi:glycosyltransferase involved in cell wall biosynthesis
MKQRFLFITRNYPPKIGGLEAYSYNLIKEFERNHTVFKIVLTRSILHLLWFLPYSLPLAFFLIRKHRIGHIHLCDGVLAPVGVVLKFFSGARLSISIHGLDITYRNPLYQLLIPWCVARLDKIICVSQSTLQECRRRGVPIRKCTVIPNGIHSDEIYRPNSKNDLRGKLEKRIGASLQDKTILVTVGRLVKRKGVAWFVSHVMPRLDTSYCYLVVGNGPEYKRIKELCTSLELDRRVFLLGEVTKEERNLIFNASDIFIMPNITVAGDVEGFGIVAIEAGSCGLPVIATKTQGIWDAVLDGKTGMLVAEKDVAGFLSAIENIYLKSTEIRSAVNSTFSWSRIYQRYRDVLI